MAIPKEVLAVLKKTPFDIIAFFLFSLAVVAFSFYLNFDSNKALKATLIPYTGWGLGNGYLFLILFIPLILLSFKGMGTKVFGLLRMIITLNMLLKAWDGIQDWQQIVPEDYTNPNPYLRYDTLTPIYTIVVPLFWVVLLTTTLLWVYLKNKKETKAKLSSAS